MSLIELQHANNIALFKSQILQSCTYCVVSDGLQEKGHSSFSDQEINIYCQERSIVIYSLINSNTNLYIDFFK